MKLIKATRKTKKADMPEVFKKYSVPTKIEIRIFVNQPISLMDKNPPAKFYYGLYCRGFDPVLERGEHDSAMEAYKAALYELK